MVREEKQQADLIRIMGTDIKSNYNLLYGFAQIKGVGIMFSNAICVLLNFDKNKKIADLSEKDIEKLEAFLTEPKKDKMPKWLLNQRKDYETGEDIHLAAKDIEFNGLQQRRRFNKFKLFRFVRTKAKLPVRGQRTRSNFRRNKTLASMKSKKVGGKK